MKPFHKKCVTLLDVVVHACNPSTLEAEARKITSSRPRPFLKKKREKKQKERKNLKKEKRSAKLLFVINDV
jgi:hypothetical protein